ncbi:MAG: hypothetical protein RLZZ352_1672 [Pseudomonadota bacterium]|jgi:hypothetical protein
MKPQPTLFRPTWAALATAALLAACGGGDAEAPPGTKDTTAPTLSISDSVSAATASGDITFNFSFSEAVTGFSADDISVTGGTKGSFSMASNGLSATLVVAPTANSTGTVQVSVAAGTFTDVAENPSTSAANASQAFDTTTPPEEPANLVSNGSFEQGVGGWTGNAANVLTEGGNSYNFANVETAGNPWDVNLSYVLNIPTAGVRYKLSFTAASNKARTLKAGIGLNQDPWTNDVKDINLTTTPQTFELTLTSNFANANSRIIFDMGHDTGHVVIDNVVLQALADEPTPNGGTLTFSSGFSSAVLTASGGLVATAGGSNQDNWGCNGTPEWCGSFAGGSGADSYAGFYYQTPSAAEGLYSQMEVFGPNVTGFNATGDTGGVTLNGQTRLNFTFNQNPEWFNSANNRFAVVLTLGKRYAIDNGCRLQLHGVKTPTSVDATAYTMTLATDFRVAADCGTGIAPDNVAAALAASPVVSSVKVMGAGGGAAILGRNNISSTANLTVPNNEGKIPTTVVLKGAITFD